MRNLEREYKLAVKLKTQHNTTELDGLIEELLTDIVNSHKGYVRNLAVRKDKSFQQDYFQCGLIGIIKALEKFDESKGFKFLTFATWYIKKEMNKFSRLSDGFMVVPDNINYILRGYLRQSEVTLEKYVEIKNTNKSFPNKTIVDNVKRLVEMEMVEPEYILSREESKFESLKEDIRNSLDERSASVVILKTMGIPFLEIAPKYKVSAERIKQVYYEGLVKLRKNREFCKVWEGVV